MPARHHLVRIALPILVAIALVGIARWRETPPAPRPQPPPALTASQLAARAGLLPVPASVLAGVPWAACWEQPMGSRHGAFTYNAQPFMAPNPARGGFHLGDDFNGIGQENTDLDSPIHAAADGLVAYAGCPSPGWGGVVILLHQTDAGVKQSFYGHLNPDGLTATPGEWVARGHPLGRLALTTAVDFAHLHFELRRGATVAPGPGYHPAGPLASENPADFLRTRLAAPGLPAASTLARTAGAGGGLPPLPPANPR